DGTEARRYGDPGDDHGRAARAGGPARRAGRHPRPGHGDGRGRPRQPVVRRRQAQGLRQARDRLLPARPPGLRLPAGGRGADRPAQRGPGRDRLHRPAAHRARRVPAAVPRLPGQGRRRAAPREPRQAGAGRGRSPALHPGGLHRAAPSARRGARRRRGGRRGPRAHRGSAARPAAHPSYGERDRDAVPHRHPRPRRPRARRRRRRRRSGGAGHHHRRHGQARGGRARRGRLARRRRHRRRRGRRRLGRGGLGLAQSRRGRTDDPRDAALQHRGHRGEARRV
ncbi:MAG: Methenyltetrahydrofolate cyclohydrolase / Methylenetetrahydrofolate dehydrogenase (NADP+), partial [uncultured Nocardioides sp.]